MRPGGLLVACTPLLMSTMTSCCSSVPVPNGAELAPPQCEPLSPVPARLTDPDPGAALQEAAVSATLLSQVPASTSENIDRALELRLVMIKQGPNAPEEAVYILQTPPRPAEREYEVVHTRAETSILETNAKTNSNSTKAPIEPETAVAIMHVWGAMAIGARWPNRERSIKQMKWGGTAYTFDYRGDNVYGQGDTVSPESGTCAAALVALAEELMRFADEQDDEKRSAIRTDLLRQARALAERLDLENSATPGEGSDG